MIAADSQTSRQPYARHGSADPHLQRCWATYAKCRKGMTTCSLAWSSSLRGGLRRCSIVTERADVPPTSPAALSYVTSVCLTVCPAYWYSREQSQCSDDQGMQLMSHCFCRWRSRSFGGRRTVLQAWSPTSRCCAAVVNPHVQSQHDHSIAWRTLVHWIVPWCNAVLSCCGPVSPMPMPLEHFCNRCSGRQDERVVKWLEGHGKESESLLAAVYSLGRSFRTQLAHYVPDPVVRLSRDVMCMRNVGWHGLPPTTCSCCTLAAVGLFALLHCCAKRPSQVQVEADENLTMIRITCPSARSHGRGCCLQRSGAITKLAKLTARAPTVALQKRVIWPAWLLSGSDAARRWHGRMALAAAAATLGVVCLARPRVLRPLMCVPLAGACATLCASLHVRSAMLQLPSQLACTVHVQLH
jgi:hypothetical protein